MNTEACVVKKELDEIEEVAELFLEKLQMALKIEKNSSRCFLIDFFFCFRIFSIWFCIHVKYYCLYNSFLLLEKKTAFLSEKPLLKFDWKVWEVKLWKMDPSTGEKGPQIAESRVTLLSNLPLPEEHKNAGDALRKYTSKL